MIWVDIISRRPGIYSFRVGTNSFLHYIYRKINLGYWWIDWTRFLSIWGQLKSSIHLHFPLKRCHAHGKSTKSHCFKGILLANISAFQKRYQQWYLYVFVIEKLKQSSASNLFLIWPLMNAYIQGIFQLLDSQGTSESKSCQATNTGISLLRRALWWECGTWEAECTFEWFLVSNSCLDTCFR